MTPVTNPIVLAQLTRARTGLILDHPFFGQLALRLNLVEHLSTKTLAVDGRNIFYNPDFVATLSPQITIAALAHEVMHPVLDHLSRRGCRDPRKWNMAGDYAINPILKDSGFQLGRGWLIDPQYFDLSADEIYLRLPEQDENEDSGGGSEPLDEMLPSADDADSTEWKIAVIQAATAARSAGKLPESLSRFVDQLTAPKVDWRERLQRFVTETSQNDFSWMRPNRKFIAQGLCLPTLYSQNMGALVSGIDTSGSIDQATLTAFGSEIKAARDASRPTSIVNIYCDSAVNHVDTFDAYDEMSFDMHGGGGTDFRPPFSHVDQHGIHPACFIYLTDGYGPFPATPPDYPVLWVMTTDVEPPWGECVRIEL